MRLIDADALIAQIEKNICEPCKKRKEDYNGVRCRACQYGDEIDDIEDAPTVDGWIPCSERLPEEEDTVLVSGWDIDYDISLINTGYMKRGKWETEESYEYGHEIRVDAWQPLPEPYMEENNG